MIILFFVHKSESAVAPYVGLQHTVPPTNTKFKPLLLPNQADGYTVHKHLLAQNIIFPVCTNNSGSS